MVLLDNQPQKPYNIPKAKDLAFQRRLRSADFYEPLATKNPLATLNLFGFGA
jgi:hypothetical protein